MSVRLAAPYPTIQTITYLPSPDFSDSESITPEVQRQYTMTGRLYTYIKTKNNRRRLLMRFNMTREKGLELIAFVRAYYRSKIQLTDHLGIDWVVEMTVNPFDFDTPGPSEWQTIQLEFEGVKL